MRPARAAAGLLLVLLVACSGQAVQVSPEVTNSLPPDFSIEGLPFHPQVEDQCGPATLATMLAARGVQVDPQSLRGKLYIPGKGGTLTTEMEARARRYGLLVYRLEPQLGPLLQEIAAENPVLVLQNLGFDWMPRWHFSVVIGFEMERQVVLLRSGYEARQEVPVELFMKTWSRARNWGVVIVQPGDLPVTAQERRLIDAAGALEQVGELAAAHEAYRAATAKWPASDAALVGAGNTAYALGYYREASGHFTALVQMRPQSAAAWNNLAYSLAQLDCLDTALAAVGCAHSIAPGNPVFPESYRELSGAASRGSIQDCQLPREVSVQIESSLELACPERNF